MVSYKRSGECVRYRERVRIYLQSIITARYINKHRLLLEKRDYICDVNEGFELFASLFGGVEAYRSLPYLDLSLLYPDPDSIHNSRVDFIRVQDLRAPIMWGYSFSGRRFVVIRKYEKLTKRFSCVEYSELQVVGGCWVKVTSERIGNNVIVAFGKKCSGYDDLQRLLQGHDPHFEIK